MKLLLTNFTQHGFFDTSIYVYFIEIIRYETHLKYFHECGEKNLDATFQLYFSRPFFYLFISYFRIGRAWESERKYENLERRLAKSTLSLFHI